MPRLTILPFTPDHIGDAGALLAERHHRHRHTSPLLSPRFQDASAAADEVRAAFETEGASGVVALRGGTLAGYLIGSPKAASWGDNAWVEAAGHAVSEPETIRDLYGAAAATWAEQGSTAYYALVPASDPDLVNAWFRLGFGHQHTHALRAVPAEPAPERSVTVRPAVREDIPVLGALELALPQHQRLSPVFAGGHALPTLEEAVAEWEEDFDDPAYAVFVAESDGAVIGSAVGCSIEKSSAHRGLSRPENAALLSFAAVLPHARGLGAGRALGEAVLHWSAEAGYASIVTDWRETNLLSSRAWPALGFESTFVRLHRLTRY